MNFSTVKSKAKALFDEASFISEIKNEADYENVLGLWKTRSKTIQQQRVNKLLLSVSSWCVRVAY